MFPSIYDRVYHQIDIRTRKILAPIRRKKLDTTDFTIISNNCWGGVCYEHFGLQKLSPTIGMYFYPEDYLKLANNMRFYFSKEMNIIDAKDSKQYDKLRLDGSDNNLIGVIDDIEAILVHYKDPKIAVEKWNRRIRRVNYDNLVFKFRQQNGCDNDHLKQFNASILPGKKIMFVNNPRPEFECSVYYHGFEEQNQISNDTFYWDKYFDVVDFLNTGVIH